MDKHFLNRFELKKELGKGSYGVVMLANDIEKQRLVALKIILKSNIKKATHIQRIRREVNILRLLHHPNISKFYEMIETDHSIVMVMEFIKGQNLFDYATHQSSYTEKDAKKMIYQILQAIKHCHENHIVHRDLKLENIMINEQGQVKLIDFGFSRPVNDDILLQTVCGSLYYCSPEMISRQGYIGNPVDMWSIGIILYILVNGYHPFPRDSLATFHSAIQNGQYEDGIHCSEDCSQLIHQLIEPNPTKRATADEALNHPWFKDCEDNTSSTDSSSTIRNSTAIPDIHHMLQRQYSQDLKKWRENKLSHLDLLIPLQDTHAGNQGECFNDSVGKLQPNYELSKSNIPDAQKDKVMQWMNHL